MSVAAGRGAIWHDIECGVYAEDLAIWRELAGERSAVLDVGAGTGRVTLDLAGTGHGLIALDSDAELLAELAERARLRGVEISTIAADAREFGLERQVDLVLAPMQLVQLLGAGAGRLAFLKCATRVLRPKGTFAAALLDLQGQPTGEAYEPPEPDVGEIDGWTYSSLPVGIRVLDRGREIALERVRTATSPDGEVDHEHDSIRLRLVDPDTFEREMHRCGLEPVERRPIAATEGHVGSTVCIGRAKY